VEFHALDERCGFAEHWRHAIPHGRWLARPARGLGLHEEHAIHPSADFGGDPFHSPSNIERALGRFTARRILEGRHRRSVADEGHRAQGNDRQEEERNDQPGAERHDYLSSLTRGPAGK
jgi:hypothetical protein